MAATVSVSPPALTALASARRRWAGAFGPLGTGVDTMAARAAWKACTTQPFWGKSVGTRAGSVASAVSCAQRSRRPWSAGTSSSPMRAARSLNMVGLGHLAGPRLFTSTLVARGKPAPDLFLYAARQMAVDPARCLVIEDSLTGIRAGLAAGMVVWRFTGGSHLKDRALDEPEDARPHLRFASFAAFYDIAPELKVQR